MKKLSMSDIKEYQKKQEYIAKARAAEKKWGIPDNMLVGVLAQESGHFDNNVIIGKKLSKAGAIGIAQFMPKTAKEYGIDPLNVDQAIDAAGKYLSKSFKIFNNWDDSLRSYNMGVGGLQKWKAGKRTLPKETAEYVGKVYKNAGISIYDTQVAPYIKTEDINLYNPNIISNIVPQGEYSVPNVYEEPKQEEAKKVAPQEEVDTQADFLKKMQDLYAQQEIPQEEIKQEQQQPIQSTDVFGIFNEVSQFVDSPLMQEGGMLPIAQQGLYKKPFQLQDERNLVQNDGTQVFAQRARPIQQLNVRNKTDKEIAQEREAKIQASVEAQKVTYTKENWRKQLASETAATGDKLRVSNTPNFFDDYINPAVMIGDMASNLGQAPLQAQQSDSNLPYFTAIGTPLVTGALGGLGAQNTGQFVNNIVNPLAGIGIKGLTPHNILPLSSQMTPRPKFNGIPTELDPYISQYMKPINREEEVFRNAMGVEYNNKKLLEDTVYLDSSGNTILNVEAYKPYIEDAYLKELNEKRNKNIITTPDKRSILRNSSIIDINETYKEFKEGGEKNSLWKNIRANKGSGKKPTKEMLEQERKIKRKEEGGTITDNNGYWNPQNWGSPVNIDSNNITMKGVEEPLIGVSNETGEVKIMKPDQDYKFANTKTVTEYPMLTEEERAFLKNYINHG